MNRATSILSMKPYGTAHGTYGGWVRVILDGNFLILFLLAEVSRQQFMRCVSVKQLSASIF